MSHNALIADQKLQLIISLPINGSGTSNRTNILYTVIADVVHVNVKMHPLTSDDRALIRA